MNEHRHDRPVRISEDTTTTMSIKTQLMLLGAVVAATGWCYSQTTTGNRHTEQIADTQATVLVLSKKLDADHEILRDLRADRRALNEKLDYLVNGRRGAVPATSSP